MTMSENQTEQPNTIVYHLTDLFDIHQDIAPVESDDKDCILANTTVMHKLDVPPAMSANAQIHRTKTCVATYEDVKALIEQHELEHTLKFVTFKVTKAFTSPAPSVESIASSKHLFLEDGIPYMIIGKKVYQCQHGVDKNMSSKIKYKERVDAYQAAGQNLYKRRRSSSKKMRCRAYITVRRLLKVNTVFAPNLSLYHKRIAIQNVKKKLSANEYTFTDVYEVSLPDVSFHNHDIDEEADGKQALDPRIIRKIHKLVGKGVDTVKAMRVHIEEYNEDVLFAGRALPRPSNRRFNPLNHTIDSHMRNAKQKLKKGTCANAAKVDVATVDVTVEDVAAGVVVTTIPSIMAPSKPDNLIDLQIRLESLKGTVNILSEKVKHANDGVNVKLPSRIQKLQKDVDLQQRRSESIQDKLEYVQENIVSKAEFKRLEQSVKGMKAMTSSVTKLRTDSITHMNRTNRDLSRVQSAAKLQGKVVNSLFMEQKQVKGSVSNMREEVNVLDGAAKKALDIIKQEMDSLYDQDHRTQKQLDELEERVEKIVEVLNRGENDRESKHGLKLEMVEKEVTKLFKFMCLVILAMSIVMFWCLWWQYRVHSRDPRTVLSQRQRAGL
ncbi:hypothetical protein EB796_007699 [Bugula neritina]|uniref:Uncharacterized protein n=1 Tax=Bugula neritina TaxID=10212 RepID=A0A7J7K6X0_BUGNE|nr:hypothetical protein EB796_007699 [Bugula neritina]